MPYSFLVCREENYVAQKSERRVFAPALGQRQLRVGAGLPGLLLPQSASGACLGLQGLKTGAAAFPRQELERPVRTL